MYREKIISVVIPFYENKDLLIESINSVFHQTVEIDELLIVSDGSYECIDELQELDYRINVLKQSNKGCGIARLNGILHSRGDYIAFMDSDDEWAFSKLEEQIDFMETHKLYWSHTGFCYKDFTTGRILRKVDNSNDFGNVYNISFVSLNIASPSVVIVRNAIDVLKDIKIPSVCKYGQDGYIFQALARKFPLGLLKKNLLNVRYRPLHTSSSAIKRFEIRNVAYITYKEVMNNFFVIRIIYLIYYNYHKLFSKKVFTIFPNSIKEKICFVFWLLPHFIEYLYKLFFIISRPKSDYKFVK